MDLLGAVVAGIAGTIIMSMVMMMAPRMGIPEMDIPGMLGSMFNSEGNRTMGMVLHLLMGIIFAIVYALLWNAGIGTVTWLWGVIFGAVHWLFSGLMMGGVPMIHAGVKAGTVEAPGIYMKNTGGMMAFLGGLIGHVIFGLVVAIVYGLFV